MNVLFRKLGKLWWILRRSRRPLLLLSQRCAPTLEHAALLRQLQPAVVIDIGANVGQFSVLVRQLLPACRLFLVEPLPAAHASLRRIFGKDQNAALFQAAIGEQAGQAPMHVSQRADSSSLLAMMARQEDEHPGTAECGQIDVPVAPLGRLIDPRQLLPDATLVKIDVQGYELQVIRGMRDLLQSIRWIYCEVSFVELYQGQALAFDVTRELETLGFVLDRVETLSRGRSGQVVQADVLYRRV